MKKGNVLMVCLGNICRSPLAHGIFEHLSKDFSITVDSAGTANYHAGNAPDQEILKPLHQKESILQIKKHDNSLPQTLLLLIIFLSWIKRT